ncbi:MAG: Na+/H+ antiporter subunit E [Clostridiales bacterium]|nr:Na+/H+ antiporter subunit E [Clostridiales bacterium]
MYVLTFVLWLILNARLTWEVAGMGLVLTALFGVFFGCFLDYRPRNELRAWRRFFLMLGYVGLLIREVIKSNLAMIDIVWDKSVPVAPTLITFDVPLQTRFCRMLLANSITLTPGTITVSVDGSRFTVHCLSRSMIEGIESGGIARLLGKMEAV